MHANKRKRNPVEDSILLTLLICMLLGLFQMTVMALIKETGRKAAAVQEYCLNE